MVTVLIDQQEVEVHAASDAEALWLDGADLGRVTGFVLKPEGLCKGAICVPLPRDGRDFARADGAVDLAAIWRHMGHPAVHDETGEVWALGTGAAARASTLAELEAPDFALPDLDGRAHSLRELRGRKVLLVTWASW